MWTQKRAVLVLLALAALLGGVLTEQPRLSALAAPLISYLALSFLFRRPLDLALRLERTVSPERALEGEEADVVVAVTNLGSPRELLELQEELPMGATVVGGATWWAGRLETGEQAVLRYRLRFALRGRRELGPLYARTRDLAGLTFSERAFPRGPRFDILPLVEDLGHLRLRLAHPRRWLGEIPSRRLGIGGEFHSIRLYEPGDPERGINWKASARTGELQSNRYLLEQSGDAILVIDARERANVGHGRNSILEHQIRAALSVAALILRERNRVGLLVLGHNLTTLYPAFGRRQLYRMLYLLTGTLAGETWPIEHLTWAVEKFFPREMQVIALTPLLDDGIVSTLQELRGMGYPILVISPSGIELERALYADDLAHKLAARLMRLERENRILRLSRMGLAVDWDPATPLRGTLVRAAPLLRGGRHR